jgi:ethanolamine ammonia-lyase small subunit
LTDTSNDVASNDTVRSPRQTLADLKPLTPARVGLGQVGASLPTQALLDFTLDHARARDAVHSPFDVAGIRSGLQQLGLDTLEVSSRALDRSAYLKRPDLGRMLDVESRALLESQDVAACDVLVVIGDGLSPAAVNQLAVALARNLIVQLKDAGLRTGPVVIATGARVALGDDIGALLNARMVVLLIGERPGLSAPHSVGAYVTYAPRTGLTDAERNCVSNIHAAGLGYAEAAFKIAWLVREGLKRAATGVALKDESGTYRTSLPPA